MDLNEIYHELMNAMNDVYMPKDSAIEIFKLLRSDIFSINSPSMENRLDLVNGLKFYIEMFDEIIQVKNMNELKLLIKRWFIDRCDSEYMQSKYNLVQGAMKACIHQIWWLCFNIHNRLRSTPQEGINDIIDPIGVAQKIYRDIMDELILNEDSNHKIHRYL